VDFTFHSRLQLPSTRTRHQNEHAVWDHVRPGTASLVLSPTVYKTSGRVDPNSAATALSTYDYNVYDPSPSVDDARISVGFAHAVGSSQQDQTYTLTLIDLDVEDPATRDAFCFVSHTHL
jgi:hypothetical protein